MIVGGGNNPGLLQKKTQSTAPTLCSKNKVDSDCFAVRKSSQRRRQLSQDKTEPVLTENSENAFCYAMGTVWYLHPTLLKCYQIGSSFVLRPPI